MHYQARWQGLTYHSPKRTASIKVSCNSSIPIKVYRNTLIVIPSKLISTVTVDLISLLKVYNKIRSNYNGIVINNMCIIITLHLLPENGLIVGFHSHLLQSLSYPTSKIRNY
jgi:hypothetical protein